MCFTKTNGTQCNSLYSSQCIFGSVMVGQDYSFHSFYSFLLFIVIVAFSGLGFLSLYFAGKLHCFQAQGRGQGWKLCVALVPVTCALALALTRYSDYRHHWQGTGLCIPLYCRV